MGIDRKDRVVVLGASGFIGRNLFDHLKTICDNVVGTQISGKYDDLITCDLTQYENVVSVVKDAKYVFMCAANTYGIGVLSQNPESLVRGSVVMNANVFDACHNRRVHKVVFLSSSVVYQDSCNSLAEEDLDLNQDPYRIYLGVGWVKRYAEKLAGFYRSKGTDIVSIRVANVYGPLDKYDERTSHVIPAIIRRALLHDGTLTVWGNGHSQKDLVYIDDFVRDVLLVCDGYSNDMPINLCSGSLHSIRDIVNSIVGNLSTKPVVVYDETKPTSVVFKQLNKNKFDSLFGKQQYTPIDIGIRKTMEWMSNALACNDKLKTA